MNSPRFDIDVHGGTMPSQPGTNTAAVFSLSEMVDALTMQGPYIPRH